jgi:hypothetical protein
MSTNTSIGSNPDRGSNDDPGNADGCGNKTLGDSDQAAEQPPTGADSVIDQASAQVPSGVAGGKAKPGIAKGAQAYPDGPNVESSPWELDAARGKLPKGR